MKQRTDRIGPLGLIPNFVQSEISLNSTINDDSPAYQNGGMTSIIFDTIRTTFGESREGGAVLL